MNSIIHYNYAALYSDLLEPFRSEAFGPRLATILLLLAVVVLIGFGVLLSHKHFDCERMLGSPYEAP